jgi:hypothetical protein
MGKRWAGLPAVLGLALVLTSGCGPAGRWLAVGGTVTLDGEPVQDGRIMFLRLDGEGGADRAGGRIEQGKYALPAGRGLAPGKYRVELTWAKKTGKQVPAPHDPPNMMDETQEAIPARYNKNSELTADVQRGHTTFDFNLTSM